MKHRRAIGRVGLRASIFLLLGAIVNIAVAWGCAVWIDPGQFPDVRGGIGEGPVIWGLTVTRRTGGLLVRRFPHDSNRKAYGYRNIRDEIPSWSEAFATDPAEALARGDWRSDECASGWPLVSLCCDFNPQEIAILAANADQLPAHVRVLPERIEFVLRDGTGRPVITRSHGDGVHNGLLLAATPDPQYFASLKSVRVLPLHPIWFGSAINTLFYAVILWLLLAVPLALRRRRRIRRGLCPACAYPVGTSNACTECGKPVKVT